MRTLPRSRVREVWSWLRDRDTHRPQSTPDMRVVAMDGGQSTELYIYDDIGMWGITAADVVHELLNIGTPRITVRLNTNGGDAFDGIAIYNALVEHPAMIDVSVDGLAASAGSLIAMAGQTRTMKRGTQMMVHDAHAMVAGNEADMRDMADLLASLCTDMAEIYADSAGGTPEAWREVMRATRWYGGADAVAAGLATDHETGAAGTTEPPALTPAASSPSFLYAGRAAAPAPVPPAAGGAASSPATAPATPPPVSRTGAGWSDLDPVDIAAAFAAVNTTPKQEVAR